MLTTPEKNAPRGMSRLEQLDDALALRMYPH